MTPNQIAYRQYLESDHWRSLRAEAYRVHGRKCFKCPRKFGLEVHHLRYRNPWTECTVEDVRPCCWQCHDQEHGIVREIPLTEKRTIEKKHRSRKKSKKAKMFERWQQSKRDRLRNISRTQVWG
jgi:hypothetical protein